MESLDYRKIRAYCKEAVDIADEFGPEEGIGFILREKFCPLLKTLKETRNKMKYLYNEEERIAVQPLIEKDQAYRLNYMMAVENNYKKLQNEIEDLERLRDDFILEIRDSFDGRDINEFLDTYPSLGVMQTSFSMEDLVEPDADSPMSAEDLLQEADDLFLVEEVKHLMRDKRLTR